MQSLLGVLLTQRSFGVVCRAHCGAGDGDGHRDHLLFLETVFGKKQLHFSTPHEDGPRELLLSQRLRNGAGNHAGNHAERDR